MIISVSSDVIMGVHGGALAPLSGIM